MNERFGSGCAGTTGAGTTGAPTASRRRFLMGLAALGLATTLAGCGGTATGGKPGIWKVAAGGGEPVFISNWSSRPAWSPDGSRIALAADSGIWVVSSSGVDSVRVLGITDPAPPSFSPDGSRIAAMDPERRQLHIVDRDGRNASAYAIGQTTHGDSGAPAVERNIPSWSPDGKSILVSGWDGSGDSIYRVDAATGQAVEVSDIRISNVPFASGKPGSPNRATANAVWPAWSPDGATIAFAALPQVSKGPGGVYVVPGSGGDQRRLAPVVPSFGPLWSPDGATLLAVAPTDKGTRLVLIDAKTGDMSAHPLPDDLVPIDAAWSPDGTRIAFSASGAIHVIGTADGAISTVADTPLVNLSPAWSPDGAWIAFRSEEDQFDQPALPPSA